MDTCDRSKGRQNGDRLKDSVDSDGAFHVPRRSRNLEIGLTSEFRKARWTLLLLSLALLACDCMQQHTK